MRKLLSAGACLAIFSATALGQGAGVPPPRVPPRAPSPPAVADVAPVRASTVLGASVALRGGETLGKITDMVMTSDGRVDYLVVRDRDELLAVPWSALRHTAGDRVLTVIPDIRRDRLKAVYFRDTNWPNFYSERWMRTATPVWGERYIHRGGAGEPRGHRSGDPLRPGGTANPEDRRPPTGPPPEKPR